MIVMINMTVITTVHQGTGRNPDTMIIITETGILGTITTGRGTGTTRTGTGMTGIERRDTETTGTESQVTSMTDHHLAETTMRETGAMRDMSVTDTHILPAVHQGDLPLLDHHLPGDLITNQLLV